MTKFLFERRGSTWFWWFAVILHTTLLFISALMLVSAVVYGGGFWIAMLWLFSIVVNVVPLANAVQYIYRRKL